MNFISEGAKFKEEPIVDALKCDSSDENANWVMNLPILKFQDQLQATIKLDPDAPNNELFEMPTPTEVVLNSKNKKIWLEGKLCPLNGAYEITFLIESPFVEDSRLTASLTISSDITEEARFDASKFAEALLQRGGLLDDGVKPPALKSDNVEMSFSGKIVIKFPSEFNVPEDWESIN